MTAGPGTGRAAAGDPPERGASETARGDDPAVLPLHSGDPERLGPFSVVGRLGDPVPQQQRGPDLVPPAGGAGAGPAREEAAAAFAAHAPDGRPVRVVLLGAGPSRDAAARDRFTSEVDRLGRSGSLLGADLRGPWPWAATAAGDTTSASRLLRAPLAAPLGVLPSRGPSFSPHWTGSTRGEPGGGVAAPGPGAPATGAPAPDRRPWVVSAVLAVLLLLALAALLWSCAQPTSQQSPQPTQQPSQQPTPSPSGSEPTPGPSTGETPGSPDQQDPSAPPGEEGSPLLLGPGVVGPSFGVGDDTQTLTLDGLPFSFRVPAGWSCEPAEVPAPAVRYDCAAPSGEAAGYLQLQLCAQPCGQSTWDALQDQLAPGATWFDVDQTTDAAEDPVPGSPGTYQLRMSHLLVAGEREESDLAELDTHLFAEFSAPAQERQVVQAVVNDLRANTP